MSATKFTPGPLEVYTISEEIAVEQIREYLKLGKGDVWGVFAPKHEFASENHTVATATTGNGPGSEANARLYAAAPSLYVALDTLLKSAVHEAMQGDGVSEEMWPHVIAARAALAKARGES